MKVLIVIDMQNDFIDGSLGTKEAVAIVPEVAKKIAIRLENIQQKINKTIKGKQATK